MSRAEWLKRLQEMQAELDEHGITMWVHTGDGYLRGVVFEGDEPAAEVWITDDEQESNERSWSEFESEVAKMLPWWEVE